MGESENNRHLLDRPSLQSLQSNEEWGALQQLWQSSGMSQARLLAGFRVQNRGLMDAFAAQQKARSPRSWLVDAARSPGRGLVGVAKIDLWGSFTLIWDHSL